MGFLGLIIFLAGGFFVYKMPELLWETTYTTLFDGLATDTLAQRVTEIAQALGVSEQTLRQACIEKLLICGAVALLVIIISIAIAKSGKKKA